MNTIDIILVIAFVLSAVITVTSARLLRAAIVLAITSAILSIMMFRLNSPLAAVFELSVCAGLIPVIFISAIGLTQRLGGESLAARKREKLRLYWQLPLVVLLACGVLLATKMPFDFAAPGPAGTESANEVLWNLRHIDLIGQILALTAGAFGVVILVKESKRATK